MIPIGPAIDGLLRALDDLIVDQEVIDKVTRTLDTSSDELHGGSFQKLKVPETIFGGEPSGQELGRHHGQAHQIVSDTINGVVADLRGFRANVIRATELVTEADETSAADFRRGAGILTRGSRSDQAEQANRESRNENLPPMGAEGTEG